jgi:hypothetical protein
MWVAQSPPPLHHIVLHVQHDVGIAITRDHAEMLTLLRNPIRKLGYYFDDHVRLHQIKRTGVCDLKDVYGMLDPRHRRECLNLSPGTCSV